MIGSTDKSLINTQIGNHNSALTSSSKKSVNKYYNIFSKKMEELDLPNIDLEFNAVLIPEKSKYMWTC